VRKKKGKKKRLFFLEKKGHTCPFFGYRKFGLLDPNKPNHERTDNSLLEIEKKIQDSYASYVRFLLGKKITQTLFFYCGKNVKKVPYTQKTFKIIIIHKYIQ